MAARSLEELATATRGAMRRMAQGVCIVSAVGDDGSRYAMTASSVTSVSLEPPSLLVCVNKQTQLHPVLAAGADFCINVLASGMQEIADRCAGEVAGEERFAIGDWRRHAETGLPYLADAQVNIFCEHGAGLVHGTHLICVGNVVDLVLGQAAALPLIYHDGAYRS